MARIRSIKPDFFTDEDLAELPFYVRLFYAGLWTEADRSGRLEDRPKQLKVKIMPYDKVDVEDILKTLATTKTTSGKPFIVRYESDGVKYIQILSWERHQKPHPTEKASIIPPPNLNNIQEHVNEPLDTRSITQGKEGKGREGKGREVLYVDWEQSTSNTWNSFCDSYPSLAKVIEISGKRREKLKKRFEKESFRGFDKILEAIKQQPFLIHGNPDSKDHKRWRVSFDWLIENDTNYLKVLEMKYAKTVDNKTNDSEFLRKLREREDAHAAI